MQAVVYRGPGLKSLDERPKPGIIAASDAVVRITHTTICGASPKWPMRERW